jgi:hypothetical protein
MSNNITRNLNKSVLAFSFVILQAVTAFSQHANLATTPSSTRSIVGVWSDYSLGNGGQSFINDLGVQNISVL